MKVKNMCEGNPYTLIFFFSLPLMLGNVFQQLYTVADTVIVSQTLGVQALAALGACDWLNWMGFGIVTGFAQGFSILVSNAFGSGKKERVQDSIATMCISSLVVTIIFVLILVPLLPTILHMLHTSSDIFDATLLYTRIIYIGLPCTMFYNVFASILRALGNSKTPLWAMILAALINIVLDIIFVVYFHWGIAGAGIATVIAQGIAGLYCLLRYLTLKDYVPKHRIRDRMAYKQMMKLGTPMAAQNVLIAVGGMVLTSVINQFGTLFLAGFTTVNKLYGILEVSAVSYGYAMVTYTAQNYGAKQMKRIKAGLHSGVVISCITAALISLLLLLFGRDLLSLFVDSKEAGYQEVMDTAWTFLRLMAWFLPVLYLLHIYRSTIQGLSDTIVPMLSGMLELLVRISAALILPIFFAKSGLYPIEVLAWFGAVILLLPSYYIKQKKILLEQV